MRTEKLEKILDVKYDLILSSSDMNSFFETIKGSEREKAKVHALVKNKLELLISSTPTGELRNELTEINILLNLF